MYCFLFVILYIIFFNINIQKRIKKTKQKKKKLKHTKHTKKKIIFDYFGALFGLFVKDFSSRAFVPYEGNADDVVDAVCGFIARGLIVTPCF